MSNAKTRSEMLTIAASTSALAGAKLTNRGSGIYSWSNKRDVMAPGYLSANVYRESVNGKAETQWAVRFFVGQSDYTEHHIATLGLVRQTLARVVLAYAPDADMSESGRVGLVQEISRAAMRAAYAAERDAL
jgi:hypothetical protein